MSGHAEKLQTMASVLADVEDTLSGVRDELHAVIVEMRQEPPVEPPDEEPPEEEEPEDPPPEEEEEPEEEPGEPAGKLEARFTATSSGLTVNVDRTGSSRPSPTGLKTEWDFGDGQGWQPGKARDSHTYRTPGDKHIQLRITQLDTGEDSTAEMIVPVSGSAPTEPPPDVEPLPDPLPDPDPDPGPPPTIPPTGFVIPKMPQVRAIKFDRKMTSQERRAAGWDDIDILKGGGLYVPDPTGKRGNVLMAPFSTAIRPGTSPIQNVQTLNALGLTEACMEVGILVDADFFGNWTEENKQTWLGINTEGNNIFLTLRGTKNTSAFTPGVKIQGLLDPRQETSSDGVVKGGTVKRMQWVDCRVYVKMNSRTTATHPTPNGLEGDKADGILALEINGQVVSVVTDMNFTQRTRPNDVPKVNSAQLDPTWGGGGAPNPQAGAIYYDRFIISGR